MRAARPPHPDPLPDRSRVYPTSAHEGGSKSATADFDCGRGSRGAVPYQECCTEMCESDSPKGEGEGAPRDANSLAIVNVLRHLVSSYQQFMSGTGARNVARLFVRLLHSDGHIPSWKLQTVAAQST